MLLKELWQFLKSPDYQVDINTELNYRLKYFLRLLGLALLISISIGLLIAGVDYFADINLGTHAVDKMLQRYSKGYIFLAAVVLAPILEELIFRGPMVFFKRSRYFSYIFYILTLVFGFYHIVNFEISPTILAISPLLVAPQLSTGAILGFIRVRFGLLWAIALHAAYNLFLLGPLILTEALNTS